MVKENGPREHLDTYLERTEEQRRIEFALAFVEAAEKGRLYVVKLLLATGVDIHAFEDKALCLAAQAGRSEVVEFLLENGADVHVKKDYPLCLALNGCHTKVVKLIEKRIRKIG